MAYIDENFTILDESDEVICLSPLRSALVDVETTDFNTFSQFDFFLGVEGTAIRVFYHNDTWNLCTMTRLDAKTNWNDKKTFEKVFLENVPENFFVKLYKNYSYTFLLSYPRNRLYTFCPDTFIFLISVFDRESKTLLSELPVVYGSIKPICVEIKTLEELKKKACEYEGGIVAIQKTTNTSPIAFRFVSKDYIRLSNIVGNVPLVWRFFETIGTEEFEFLKAKFPIDYLYFSKRLSKMVDKLFTEYVNYFIKKRTTHLEKPVFVFLRGVHETFLDNKRKNINQKISKEDISRTIGKTQRERLQQLEHYLITYSAQHSTPNSASHSTPNSDSQSSPHTVSQTVPQKTTLNFADFGNGTLYFRF